VDGRRAAPSGSGGLPARQGAVGLHIYDITGSTGAVALLGVFGVVPITIAGVYGVGFVAATTLLWLPSLLG
jgi:hypothetical protein